MCGGLACKGCDWGQVQFTMGHDSFINDYLISLLRATIGSLWLIRARAVTRVGLITAALLGQVFVRVSIAMP